MKTNCNPSHFLKMTDSIDWVPSRSRNVDREFIKDAVQTNKSEQLNDSFPSLVVVASEDSSVFTIEFFGTSCSQISDITLTDIPDVTLSKRHPVDEEDVDPSQRIKDQKKNRRTMESIFRDRLQKLSSESEKTSRTVGTTRTSSGSEGSSDDESAFSIEVFHSSTHSLISEITLNDLPESNLSKTKAEGVDDLDLSVERKSFKRHTTTRKQGDDRQVESRMAKKEESRSSTKLRVETKRSAPRRERRQRREKMRGISGAKDEDRKLDPPGKRRVFFPHKSEKRDSRKSTQGLRCCSFLAKAA